MDHKSCNTCLYNIKDECVCGGPCLENEKGVPSNYVTRKDNVDHPSHYTNGKIECIDALESATEGLQGIEAVCTANAIKYLWRWKHKNGKEDLKKAIWYINKLIEKLGE